MATHSQEHVVEAASSALSGLEGERRRRWESAHQFIFLVAETDLASVRRVARTCENGFLAVRSCSTARELLFLAGRLEPGLLLLRASLPDGTAAEVIETIREHDDVPIIVSVGEGETMLAAPALLAGATALTDYPYREDALAELVRRHATDFQARMLHEARVELGALVLDGPGYVASVNGRQLPLTPRAFELLQLLVNRAGRVVSYEEMRESIWLPRGEDVSRQTVTVHLHRLREQLRGAAEITAIRGVGYRLTGESRL